MTWHQPSSLTSVAKVTGLAKVPTPPAVLCRQGWAMAGPGGELSAQPYSVMNAFTLVGPWALAAVGAPKTLSATASAPRTRRLRGERRRDVVVTAPSVTHALARRPGDRYLPRRPEPTSAAQYSGDQLLVRSSLLSQLSR